MQSEVEEAIEVMRGKQAIEDDFVPRNERTILGEYDLGIMKLPINNKYENGVWRKVFIAVTLIKF